MTNRQFVPPATNYTNHPSLKRGGPLHPKSLVQSFSNSNFKDQAAESQMQVIATDKLRLIPLYG